MKYLSTTFLATTLLAASAFAADVQKPTLSVDLESEVTVNTQAFTVDPNARLIPPPAQTILPTCAILKAPIFTAKGNYAENVCFTEPTLGSIVTNLGTNKIVYFNALPAAKTYTFKGIATGHASKTAPVFTVPANTIAAVCMNAKFNAAKGINYYFNFATGMSPPPASFCQ